LSSQGFLLAQLTIGVKTVLLYSHLSSPPVHTVVFTGFLLAELTIGVKTVLLYSHLSSVHTVAFTGFLAG